MRALVVPVLLALAMAGCKDTRDKIKNRLYPVAGDDGWPGDSAYIASNPSVLYRVIHKNGQQYVFPLATVGARSGPLGLSQRGWAALDSTQLWSTKSLFEMDGATVGAKVSMHRGMWENSTYPLDTVQAACARRLPIGEVALSENAALAISNYKAPQSGGTVLDAGALQQAIEQVPQLVTPPLGISASVLATFHRNVHQIPHAGSTPTLVLQYDDPAPVLDSGSVRERRPHNLILVMEKGIYGYRPTWVYRTTGMTRDLLPLTYLGAIDLNADGWPELFFRPTLDKYAEITFAYRHWNETWRESWRMLPVRCVL